MRRLSTFGLFASFGLFFGLVGCEPTTTTDTAPLDEPGAVAPADPATDLDSMTPAEPTGTPAGDPTATPAPDAAPEVTPPTDPATDPAPTPTPES